MILLCNSLNIVLDDVRYTAEEPLSPLVRKMLRLLSYNRVNREQSAFGRLEGRVLQLEDNSSL